MPDPFALKTADPRFNPNEPVTINGYAYVPADQCQPRVIPAKPVDPLVAVMAFNSLDTATAEQRAANLREDAKALGYEIKLVEVGDAD